MVFFFFKKVHRYAKIKVNTDLDTSNAVIIHPSIHALQLALLLLRHVAHCSAHGTERRQIALVHWTLCLEHIEIFNLNQ